MDWHRIAPCVSLAALALAAGACGDGVGPADPGTVSLSFQVTDPGASPVSEGPAGASARVAGPPMVIAGANGSLILDEIRIIINEVELKPADGSCDSSGPRGDDCPEFEAPPRFLDLPLDGQAIDAVSVQVPAGLYKELDFEIEDLEDDESDPVEAAAVAAVRGQVLAAVPDWPEEASVLVAGTFIPTGGAAVAFRVFLKAEIEIEMDLQPNLVVADDGTSSRQLTVDIAPHLWFLQASGEVLELPLYDWDSTQQLLEFDVELEDGFTRVEIGD